MSPTARSLEYLRCRGYTAEPVERWVPNEGPDGRGIRRDWGHFADLLAVHPGRREFLLVQSTTLPNLSTRIDKARGRPELAAWLNAGGRFELHGWALRRGRWAPKIVEVSPADLATVILAEPPRNRRRSPWQPGELFGPTSDVRT